MAAPTNSEIKTLIVIINFMAAYAVESWTFTVKTSEENLSGTRSNIHLTVYGIYGNIERTKLGTTDHFQRGSLDSFTLQGNVGSPYKIKLEHDGTGPYSKWKIQYIMLSHGSQCYKFEQTNGQLYLLNKSTMIWDVNAAAFTANTSLIDVKMTSSVLWQTKAHLGQCAILCYKDSKCQSFTVADIWEECRGHGVRFSTGDEGEHSTGFLVYNKN